MRKQEVVVITGASAGIGRATAIAFAKRGARIGFGWPTTKAVVGNNFAPGYADRYLAEHGYEAQMIDEREEPGRPDNLWAAVDADRDHGAHGVFDSVARNTSIELEFNKRRGWFFAATAVLAIAALASRTR